MTKENCIKYMEEATDEETKKFWSDRIARKYPEVKEVKKVAKKEDKE